MIAVAHTDISEGRPRRLITRSSTLKKVLPIFSTPGKESASDPAPLKDPTGKPKIERNNCFLDCLKQEGYGLLL